MTDVLTAIDDALDTGVAAHEDPMTRELQELALALRSDAPEPAAAFSERLGRRVEAGFPKQRRSRRLSWPGLSWSRLMSPALALGLILLLFVVLAVVAGPSDRGGDAGGGGGGVAAVGGGGGRAGAGDDEAGSLAAPAGGGSAKRSADHPGGNQTLSSRSTLPIPPPSEGR